MLLNAIVAGLHSKDYFAYADMIDEKGRYRGLIFGSGRSSADDDGQSLLVKPEIAQKQLNNKPEPEPKPPEGPKGGPVFETPPKRMRRFFGSVELDPKRVGRDAASIAEEVIQHLELERGGPMSKSLSR